MNDEQMQSREEKFHEAAEPPDSYCVTYQEVGETATGYYTRVHSTAALTYERAQEKLDELESSSDVHWARVDECSPSKTWHSEEAETMSEDPRLAGPDELSDYERAMKRAMGFAMEHVSANRKVYEGLARAPDADRLEKARDRLLRVAQTVPGEHSQETLEKDVKILYTFAKAYSSNS